MDGGTDDLVVHEQKKTFKCNSNKQSLNVHIKSVHEQKKPFKCDECDKAFFWKKSLIRRIKMIKSVKVFPFSF